MPNDYAHINDDLVIADGDFVVAESTKQHQSLMIRLNKGEQRQFPKTGVGIDSFLQDDNPGDVDPEIRKQFEADTMTIRDIDVRFNEDGELMVRTDAYYP
jgi:hypothetical protein